MDIATGGSIPTVRRTRRDKKSAAASSTAHRLHNEREPTFVRNTNMERNEFSSRDSTQGQTGGSTAGSGVGNSGMDNSGAGNSGSTAGSQGYAGSTSGSSAGSANADDRGMTDRARDMASTAQDKLADVGSGVRERAGTLKNSLADALESGADRIRQRGGQAASGGQNSQLAGATGTGSVSVGTDGRGTQVTERVASGMDATAGWLRDADLEGLRTGIETQVKEHPGRTLLLAAGLGYLLGKALRK
jgi:ElaB/YqjD/DUF883 family membrane-anchored ribosome-binding protein